ncbi:MAG: hypothetical protein IJG33_08490 [Selenomonadaceae bacterium]|nr:hypothetical protein [Selenomonadaceae bacterium]
MVNIDYLYNPEAVREIIYKNYFVDKKLGFIVIENGTILPQRYTDDNGKRIPNFYGVGGIADSQGKFVTSSFINNSGAGGVYIPPPNQFNTARKPLFILLCFIMCGGTL